MYTPEQKAVQTLLAELRKERGLRQIDLAERLQRSQQFVSRYEEGQKVLDLPELRQVCNALGIRLAEFVQLYEERLTNSGLEENLWSKPESD